MLDEAPRVLLRNFLNPSPAENDGFGRSVAAIGNNFVVGAPGDDTAAADGGAAYLFDETGHLLRTLMNPTPVDGDWFGVSVAALGNDVLVGAPGSTVAADNGAAYLFDGTTGGLLLTFLNPTPGDDDFFGGAVAAVGSWRC